MSRSRAARNPRPYTAAQVAALGPFAEWKAQTLALANGAAVTSWADSSGNGNTLTQPTTTKQPTYATGQLNGLPMVRFSATNVSAMTTAFFTALGAQGTVFVVAKAPTATPSATQYLTGASSSGSRRDLYYTTARAVGAQGPTAGVTGSATTPANAGFIATGIFDGANSVTRHDSMPTGGDTGTAAPSQIKVGARNGETASFDGWIGHVLYFSKRLTAAQILGVEQYLSRLWGIPLTQAGVVYVNGATGDDTANNGRSPQSPLKTLSKANSVSGASGRIEATGEFRELVSVTGTAARLIRLKDATWYGSERITSGWVAAGGGVYSKAVTGYGSTLTHMRVVSDLDPDGFWTTLTPNTATPTTPGVGEFGFTASTIYIHLAGNADPNTKTIEAPKFDYALFSRSSGEVVLRSQGGSKVLMGNRTTIAAGSAGTDGRIVCIDVEAGYGGDNGTFGTQNDATSFARYRCESYRSMNDGGNWHGTTGRVVSVYSEDCNDHHNYDEGESSHDNVAHVVRGGWKHHNVTGGGITNVMATTLDADGSAAGPLLVENNRTAGPTVADQGGISVYDATTSGVVGPRVVCRNNNGANFYINPGSVGSSVHPTAKAASVGGALPDTTP